MTTFLKQAADILQSMNDSIDPCEDFYQFSCGAFMKSSQFGVNENEISSMTSLKSTLNSKLIQLFQSGISSTDSESDIVAKSYYESCLDPLASRTFLRTFVFDLYQKLSQNGGWPLLTNATNTITADSLFKKMVNFNLIQNGQLFTMKANLMNSSDKLVLEIRPPNWLFSADQIALDNSSIKQMDITKMLHAAHLLMAVNNLTVDDNELIPDLLDIYQIILDFSIVSILLINWECEVPYQYISIHFQFISIHTLVHVGN